MGQSGQAEVLPRLSGCSAGGDGAWRAPFYGDFNPQRLRPDRYRLKNSAGKETRHGCTGNPVIGIEYDPDLVRRPME
jgi:hypothetical protein